MSPSRSLHQALEAELAANPDDLATHAAYADLLSEEGDARGEFIQTQVALEDPLLEPAERQRLVQREHQLRASYQERWLGALAPMMMHESGHSFHFRRGWLDAIEIGLISLHHARILREAPQARLLRELAIRSVRYEEGPEIHPDDGVPEGEAHPGLWPLVNSPNLANVRKFTLGNDDGDDYEDYEPCTLNTPAVPLLLRGMPEVEEVRLFARGYSLVEVFALPMLKHLRVLQVYHCSQVYCLDVLANNPAMHHLTHLLCHPHALAWHDNREDDEAAGFREAEGYLPLSVVKPLLHSPHLPHLTHLRLRNSSMGDEGCTEIVRSGILERLKMLDLRHGRITVAGAATLASSPDIGNLELLDLSYNAISPEVIEDPAEFAATLVEEHGIEVLVENQHEESDAGPERSDEYLHEGDIE
jgi:uncharacterized protein (TIGR02996 family)